MVDIITEIIMARRAWMEKNPKKFPRYTFLGIKQLEEMAVHFRPRHLNDPKMTFAEVIIDNMRMVPTIHKDLLEIVE